MDTRLIALGGDATAALWAIAASAGIDLLLLDAASPLLARPSVWTSLEALDCPVLVGR
ncbi:hypothetical protein [Thioflavicoccus mobilis]|uniref:hypothetical protein n=1 Tax=Thioflavicoccus mobilis TaxID=80679 RepID=UPI001FDEBE55|nr:hypothetical protein [Thioflavicoccus mobilis]